MGNGINYGGLSMTQGVRWAKIYESVIRDERLSQRELRVYLALALHASKSGQCYPKRERIAEITGIRPAHVSNATTRLADLGYLLKVGNGGRGRPATYQLTTPEKGTGCGTLYEPKRVPDGSTVYEPKTVPPVVPFRGQKGTTSGTPKEQYSSKGTDQQHENTSPPPGLEDVMDLYNAIAVELPKVKAAAAALYSDFEDLKQRYPKARDIEWWRTYFTNVRRMPALLGKRNKFIANLAWLVRYDNMCKVVNGDYLDAEAEAPRRRSYRPLTGGEDDEVFKGAI